LGNLRVLSGNQVCAILTHHGFLEVRQRGSHVVMQKRLPDTTITIPVPNHTNFVSAHSYPLFASLAYPGANSNLDLSSNALQRTRKKRGPLSAAVRQRETRTRIENSDREP
jgi:predicted RNA binding protein YcfA (HicA-like mRNA interferase family)